ncbi:MAG: DUF4827 domain-containing protein [Bacteroidaceae bacterium]|nr:DUF4827 domain-containing protein [Bacteroidaceae bacterium]
MKQIVLTIMALVFLTTLFSCDNGETYADMKEKEKKAIDQFIKDNEFTGPIKVISQEQFVAQDSTTNVDENEFVLFNEDGIYMQIVSRGEGKSLVEFAKEQSSDSTISKTVLCRFFEYDIEAGEMTINNIYSSSIVDKMLVKYIHRSRRYQASFIEGQMVGKYKSSVVPQGWIKPLDYIRLTRNSGRIAKIRIIVPHSSGTSNASGYVLPMYYEISYQLGI